MSKNTTPDYGFTYNDLVRKAPRGYIFEEGREERVFTCKCPICKSKGTPCPITVRTLNRRKRYCDECRKHANS